MERDRLGDPARILIGRGEVVPRGQGAGMVGAQQAFPAGQDLLEQQDRLGGPARLPVGRGEIVASGQGPGVIGAQRRSRPARICSNSGIASAARPAA